MRGVKGEHPKGSTPHRPLPNTLKYVQSLRGHRRVRQLRQVRPLPYLRWNQRVREVQWVRSHQELHPYRGHRRIPCHLGHPGLKQRRGLGVNYRDEQREGMNHDRWQRSGRPTFGKIKLTLSPLSPGRPAAPRSPGIPCSPGAPWAPGFPGAPASPYERAEFKVRKTAAPMSSSRDRDPSRRNRVCAGVYFLFLFFYLSTIVSTSTGRTTGTGGADGTVSTALATETSVALQEKMDSG